jgi:hypothetical protein
MRKFAFLLSTPLCVLLWSCATPPLGMETGEVTVDDVVRSVKCELADAVDSAINQNSITQQKLAWLKTWTTRVDLTLQLEIQGGLSPSTTYVQTFQNAYSTAAGPTTLGGTTIGSIARNFSIGGGFNVNDEATRTNVLSFAQSFDELIDWRNRHPELCSNPSGTGVLSDLGLKEWVEKSLSPVVTDDLMAGNNPLPGYSSPGGAKSAVPVQKAPQKGTFQPQAALQPPTWDLVGKFVKNISAQVDATAKASTQVQATVSKARKAVQSIELLRSDPYADILSPDFTTKLNDVLRNVVDFQVQVQSGHKNIAEEFCFAAWGVNDPIPPSENDVLMNRENLCPEKPSGTYATLAEYTKASMSADSEAAKAISNAERAASLASKISKPDAPVLGVSQSVNFVVTLGASLSPAWMLTVWRGPTAALAAQGIRTHTLDIAIGPSSDQSAAIQTLQNNRIISALQH